MLIWYELSGSVHHWYFRVGSTCSFFIELVVPFTVTVHVPLGSLPVVEGRGPTDSPIKSNARFRTEDALFRIPAMPKKANV